MPLLDKPIDAIDTMAEYVPLDAAAATAAGVPPAPTSAVWLIAPGAAPCRATVGGYYSAPVEATAPNVTYGVELSGCPVPADPQNAEAIILAQDAAPSDCRLEAPQPLAVRLGDSTDKKHWQRPAKATPIPPALLAILPQHACTAPDCEMLWSIGQVASQNQPVVWAGAVNWLAIPPNAAPETQCEWKAETFSGFFTVGVDGKPTRVTDGQDHPLILTSVLLDHTGPRGLVAQTVGEYSTYDLSADGAKLAHHVVWLRANPDAYELDDHLGPECDEPDAP